MEYLENISCIFSQSESLTPVGTNIRNTGNCTFCDNALAPRCFPLFCLGVPLLGTDEHVVHSLQDHLSLNGMIGALVPNLLDPYKCLTVIGESELMCLASLPNSPHIGDLQSRASQYDVIAISLNRNHEDFGKLHHKFKFEPSIQYAGYDWQFVSAIQHIGDDVSSGHYISISSSLDESEGFTVFNDQVIVNRSFAEDAWAAINAEPEILVYEKQGRINCDLSPTEV